MANAVLAVVVDRDLDADASNIPRASSAPALRDPQRDAARTLAVGEHAAAHRQHGLRAAERVDALEFVKHVRKVASRLWFSFAAAGIGSRRRPTESAHLRGAGGGGGGREEEEEGGAGGAAVPPCIGRRRVPRR